MTNQAFGAAKGIADGLVKVFDKSTKSMLKSLTSTLGKFAPFLGAFGAVASLFGFLGDSPEVQRLDEVIDMLNKGFKRIEVRYSLFFYFLP